MKKTMKKQKKFFILLAIITTALFAAGCEDKQVVEANKFVDSANKKVNDAKPLVAAAVDKFGKISDSVKDFDESRKSHEGELKELVASYDKIAELQKGAAADFAQAAKLSKDEAFKSYYEMSVKNVENMAALVSQNRILAQALLESKTEDEYMTKVAEIKTKNDALNKEGDDISAKLKKLEEAVNAKNKS